MIVGQVNVAGVRVPSSSPVFLGLLGIHILCGLACVISGALAMLSDKRPGRHPRFGTIYYWCLAVVSVTATALSAMRWTEDYYLFILGTLSLLSATIGRTARRGHWRNWPTLHISGMGMSYILLLTAFYVDNGKNLPLWRYLPPVAYWLLPSAVGLPLIGWALLRHPIARQPENRCGQ
jgi:hypothetical protein